jgi:hypothetical protein
VPFNLESKSWLDVLCGNFVALGLCMRTLTRKQLESRKAQAVRFTRDVLGDEDRANEIEDESLEDYAQRKAIRLTNPKGVRKMAAPTRRELLEHIDQLEQENETLQSQIDEIGDIIAPPEEEEDEDE